MAADRLRRCIGSARRSNNPAIRTAILNSLIVATIATAIALVLGTLAALAVQRYSFFGRDSISFLLVLPIALPGVVTGIALQTSFVTFGVDFGLLTIVVGHATFCIVIAYNNVVARLRRLPRSPEEASADLGADMFTSFRRITLPSMGTALLSGALLAFALSFDEIIVTNFTAGAATQTLPLWIFTAIQRPTELPVVNVVALFLMLVSRGPGLHRDSDQRRVRSQVTRPRGPSASGPSVARPVRRARRLRLRAGS